MTDLFHQTTGAGPAGVATAFTLSRIAAKKGLEVNITVFEQNHAVGGRMVLDSYFEHDSVLPVKIHVEDVASGNLLRNRVLAARAGEYFGGGFGDKDGVEVGVVKVGFWDGEKMVSDRTRPIDKMSWIEWLGLVLRYGTSVWSAKKLPDGTMERYMKMLDSGKKDVVSSIDKWLKGKEMGGAVAMSASERLKLNGVNKVYVDEVLGPQLMRQFGQGANELSDLAMSMALQREEMGVQVDGVGGRLDKTLLQFLNESAANIRINTRINRLRRRPSEDGNPVWILEYQNTREEDLAHDAFDKVVLAGPWSTSEFLGEETEQEQVAYRSLWITFVVSSRELDSNFFGGSTPMPRQILQIPSIKRPRELEGTHEISHVRDIFGPDVSTQSVQYLYRILSDRKITNETLSFFGKGILVIQERIENAYPLLYPRSEGLGNFEVQEGLWHTSVVEAIGSQVDLSWVAGENVARLVAKGIEDEHTGRGR